MIKSMLACPYKFEVLYWSFANKIDIFFSVIKISQSKTYNFTSHCKFSVA